jgi:hypothetical protein
LEIREFDFQGTRLVGDLTSTDSIPSLMVLHGAGKGSRHRFEPLRAELGSRGISSVAFDCVGHGDTSGALDGTTLKSRTDQALSVLSQTGFKQPFTVLGSSMGAYTAVKLCEHLPIQNLILFVPAMYTVTAYEIPFGVEFSSCIRQPDSWRHSDAWAILSRFTGNILIVRAEKDEVIPIGVIESIKQASSNAASIVEHAVAGAPHPLAQHLAENPKQFQEVVELIMSITWNG